MKKYISSFFLLLALLLAGCAKDGSVEDQLPPITTTGANTFGCNVNGKIWVPYSNTHSVPALWIGGSLPGLFYKYKTISITANNRYKDNKSGFDIVVKNVTGTGIYKVQNILDEGMVYSDNDNIQYEPIDSYGTVNIIKLDTVMQIVSGTFSFYGKNKQFNKTVNITDGRFDLHWPYQK